MKDVAVVRRCGNHCKASQHDFLLLSDLLRKQWYLGWELNPHSCKSRGILSLFIEKSQSVTIFHILIIII